MNDVGLLTLVSSISLAIVVIGWFATSWLNRRHEIAKKRMECRIEILTAFIDLSKELHMLEKPDLAKISHLQVSFLVFGYEDEIKLFNGLVHCFDGEKLDLDKFGDVLLKLTNLVRDRLRKELHLPEITS